MEFCSLRSPEIIKQILQKNHKKYHKSTLQTEDLGKYIGKGLLTSNGEHWRTHRRMIQPAFHKKKLEGLIGIMDAAICKQLNLIKTNEPQDIYPLMGDLAFQVVAQSLFSRDDIQADMAELKRITERNQVMLIREMRQPYMNWWFKLSGAIKRHLNYSKEARNILNEIIEERISSDADKDDLLDMLLKARYEDGTAMSRDQLIDEVLILFTAGHETTANALSFTLFLLAQNQDVQELAFKSASAVNLENDNHFENLAALSYIKQCVEEGMRLYPPAYYIDRMSIEEDQLGEHTIPKNTMILLAEEFHPERFDPKNKKDFSNYYYPFGAGPRMCVGNSFAIYEMILVVARILKKYKVEAQTKEVEVDPLITLRPKEVFLKFVSKIKKGEAT
ncbi:11-oxo-beta-amyrin 30-oxidase [Nymphon striatum]|nr:11-oxo-beta-amyrin 30-oxidase [Nymphon striatum]